MSGTNRRKELIKEYRERKSVGGVYRIVNQPSGKYVIDHSANIKSIQNHFQFAQKMGGPMHMKLKNDWESHGGQAFRLEILEEVEQRDDQTPAQFIEELKTLESLYRGNFDPTLEY